ncbi:MAG TPA: transposase, partial [Bdellovibrionota bacterium]|nr:transposase [Bdellovibrionota bacterium]
MRARQLSLLPPGKREHGGNHSKGIRKTRRPIDLKSPVHLVIRSSRAKGAWSMLHPRHVEHIDRAAQKIARRHGVQLWRYSNVGNHLHLLVKTRTRTGFQNFLRELTGTVASIVTGAKKGNPVGKFWDSLAYTRIVTW